MAEVTRQGKSTIKAYVENELARELQRKWKGNLLDSQQGLAQDIKIYSDSEGVYVGSTNEVLKFLEWGTAPHVIRPDEAEALAWTNPSSGETVFAKKVEHPGTKPYGHLRNAVGQIQNEVK